MTALSVVAQDLGLTQLECRFIEAMLSATPLAASGGSTMVPVATLAKVVEQDLEPEEREELNLTEMLRNGVGVVLAGLLRQPRTCRVASEGVLVSFCVLDMVTMQEGAGFVQFHLNPMFLDLLSRVAADRGIAVF
ncbi:hypothetical protein OI25_7232 [Paraburkholderia fungorum]|jgi:hypothetical protein|uniref:Uncharacterized protein n=1 Tax=Paraburkholderia fungorum TaxID=134537 RepID=A0AAP5UZX8_9BURK|nr:hypothetical protein [Paraburkholderia fungorum]AJZ56736.1 hypothetical protein OI25_7232 [Paraburkholderia fungorum]MDT8842654.1 hypothetical protein [Paraburkholderia fungorum]PRZ49216.1 hypothetical protein BX589_126125 [Paraburkholderia fungorum]